MTHRNKNRINDFLDFLLCALEPLRAPDGAAPPCGMATHIMLADNSFIRAAFGEGGKYSLPLIGVAFQGETDRALDTSRDIFVSDMKLAVFILYRDLADLTANLRGQNELIDGVVNCLAGRIPVKVKNVGSEFGPDGITPALPVWAPVKKDGDFIPFDLDADGNLLQSLGGDPVLIDGAPVWKLDLPDAAQYYRLLGNALLYKGASFMPLPESSAKSGLSCCQVQFVAPSAFIPSWENLTRDAAAQGVDEEIMDPTGATELLPVTEDF